MLCEGDRGGYVFFYYSLGGGRRKRKMELKWECDGVDMEYFGEAIV